MPLGFPVVPDVYRMNSGCSASNASASWDAGWRSTSSCHQMVPTGLQVTSPPVRSTTSTFSTLGHWRDASSTAGLSGEAAPRR